MNLKEIQDWLEARRDEKDFVSIKQVRDKCRKLLAISNREWFENKPLPREKKDRLSNK